MNENVKDKWLFKDLIWDIDKYYVNGLNIWEYKWIYLDEYITVEDPSYKQKFDAQVLCIEESNNKIYFLAVEFSSNCWGIYLKNDYKTKLIKFA